MFDDKKTQEYDFHLILSTIEKRQVVILSNWSERKPSETISISVEIYLVMRGHYIIRLYKRRIKECAFLCCVLILARFAIKIGKSN